MASTKSRQIGLVRCPEETSAACGSPIDLEQAAPVEFLPKYRSDQGEEPRETMAPLAEKGGKAQEQVSQHGCPHLQAHRVSIGTQEVRQLERLLEFLEEELNPPSAAVEVRHTLGTRGKVVRQKDHLTQISVDLHPCHHPTGNFRIGPAGGSDAQLDDLVGQNVAIRRRLKFDHNAELQVVVDARDLALQQA